MQLKEPTEADISSNEVQPLSFAGKIKRYFSSDSIVGATLNLSNSTIGAGVLFLPFVIKETGLVFGMLLINFGGIIGAVTLYLLHRTYEKLQETRPDIKDYEEIGEYCYGKVLSFFIQFCIFILNFGCTISYTIVVSDILRDWFVSVPNGKFYHSIVLLIIMIPVVLISMSKKISNLRFFSYFSISTILLFIFFVVLCYFFGVTGDLKGGELMYFPDFTKLETYLHCFSILGVVTFAYACHTNLCPISSEFKKKNRYKIGYAIFGSILIDFGLYSFIAGFGYLSFTSNTRSDIISSYSGAGLINNSLKLLLGVSICATYPMASYPARLALVNATFDGLRIIWSWRFSSMLSIEDINNGDEIITPIPNSSKKNKKKKNLNNSNNGLLEENNGEESPDNSTDIFDLANENSRKQLMPPPGNPAFLRPNTKQNKLVGFCFNILYTTLIGIVSYLFAVFYPHAEVIFGLIGSTASTCTAYIFPCLFFLKLFKLRYNDINTYLVVGLLIFGVSFGLFVTGSSILRNLL